MSAMDVICVVDENGEYSCTPFYAGFGTSAIFAQTTEEKVHLIVNYKPIHEIPMIKDANGFVLFEGKGSIEGRRVPSPKDLKMMGLKKGVNSVAFATSTTNLMVSAKIFVWDREEKIIVTDIDGTITRSDKRGHFYSRIGLSWHHNSVVTCFQTLYNLGYKILYLTARSVTMDTITRKYLDDLQLPTGPLLLSSKGFMDAFTSEVITKDAKLGKFEHLSNVVKLFPSSNEIPIVAGFGNNENDEWAYREAKIPPDHIFIVNKKSEIIVAKAKTSYEVVSKEVCKFFKSLVDQLKNSSEMLPDSNNNNKNNENNDNASNNNNNNNDNNNKTLDKHTENPLKDIDTNSSQGDDRSEYSDSDRESDKEKKSNGAENNGTLNNGAESNGKENNGKENNDKENGKENNGKENNGAENSKQHEDDGFGFVPITRGLLHNLNEMLSHHATHDNSHPDKNNLNNSNNTTQPLVDVASLMNS